MGEAVIDSVDDSDVVNTMVLPTLEEIDAEMADIEAEIIARQVAQEYAEWYERTYTPWHNARMKELEFESWFLNLNEREDDDESQVSEGDDQINGLEGVDQEIIENFNQAMEKLQENYLAMIQTGEDE